MKTRKVVITIELETSESLKNLKNVIRENLTYHNVNDNTEVIQIQANVIKEEKK